MFSTIFRFSTTKAGKNVKELFSGLPITENRIEKLLLVRFLLPSLFGQMVEKLCILAFGPHCIISAYTLDYALKISIQTNFDTLISNFKLYFQYDIVMTSKNW